MKKAGFIAVLLLAIGILPGCQKNTVSKIPQIALTAFYPDSIKVNVDTVFIRFSIVDGDADIGNSSTSQIYLKDSRYDSAGFQPIPFPPIDPTVEDPSKGLLGDCIFYPTLPVTPRTDSLHTAMGDTLHFEMYITDRAGNESNHVVTPSVIVRP